MQSMYVFLDITKIAELCLKNADVSRFKECVTWFVCLLDLS